MKTKRISEDIIEITGMVGEVSCFSHLESFFRIGDSANINAKIICREGVPHCIIDVLFTPKEITIQALEKYGRLDYYGFVEA